MADQKRWFKVWTSILDDPHFQELSLEDIGRWTLVGAMLAGVGSGGRLRSPAGARRLREVLRTDNIGTLKLALSRLPNVHVEEGKCDNGDFTVTMDKWSYYQVDRTVGERVKRLRSKRREEEKREEEKRTDTKTTLSGCRPTALRVLEFLNRKTGRHYQPVESNLRLITARLKAGATEDQCRAVIGRKVAAWTGDAKMAEFLRPATLFNATNFAQYQGELPATAFAPEDNGHAS